MKKIGIAAVITGGLVAVGCAGGNTIDQAVPQAAFGDVAAPEVADQTAPGADGAGDAATAYSEAPAAATGPGFEDGAYPNINSEPTPSLMQMDAEQRKALLEQMQALADAHARGLVSSAEYSRRLAELRRLAETHSQDAINIIEN